MIPTIDTLLGYYYTVVWGAPFIALSVTFGLVLAYMFGFYFARKETLIYIWTVGITHSQNEHRNLYIRWKNKLMD